MSGVRYLTSENQLVVAPCGWHRSSAMTTDPAIGLRNIASERVALVATQFGHTWTGA